MPAVVEFTPGEVWESVKGKHKGLKVEIERDTGPAVKVLVLRENSGYGGRGLAKMAGRRWNINRDVFLTNYKPIRELVEKPKVEVDLSKLLAGMPVMKEAEAIVRLEGEPHVIDSAIDAAMNTNGHHKRDSLWSPVSRAKRQETMATRVKDLTTAQLDELRARRLSGEKVPSLASEFHMDVPTMGRLLSDMGLVRANKSHSSPIVDKSQRVFSGKGSKTAGQIERQYASLTDEDKLKIVEDRQAGVRHKDILGRWGILSSVAGRVYRELGFDYEAARAASTRESHRRSAERRKLAKVAQKEVEVMADQKIDEVFARSTFEAIVMVQRVVEEPVIIEASSLEEALVAARAYPGAVRVKSVSEL